MPLKRQRSLSLGSLSSLSSLTSSTCSSDAVERALELSTSASMFQTPLQSSQVPTTTRFRRPRKKKRNTAPPHVESATLLAKTSRRRRKSDTVTFAPKRRKRETRRWEVAHGYNGPCEWPSIMAEGTSYRNVRRESSHCFISLL